MSRSQKTRPRGADTPLLRFVRLWLPLLIIAAGLLIGAIGGSDTAWEGGMLVVSAGVSVWLLNVLFRIGMQGDRDRNREDAAREHFERTGRWPDERRP